jgi:aryl-alcohol dehydrogenase-like predicted oxidoreductase
MLGKSSLEIFGVAFGGNVLGWTVNETEAYRILDTFVGAGHNLVDTADVYSRWANGNKGGESETILGNWISKRGNRHRILIATKGGKEMGQGKKGLSKNYIKEAVDASLARLRTDYIDLYQAHEDDLSTTMEESLQAFDDLVKEGKIRYIGASNFSASRLAQSLEVSSRLGLPRYESLQPLYNLYDREIFEKELGPLCSSHQIGVLSYYSLAKGFLTGKYRSEKDLSKSPRGPGTRIYMNDRGMRILQGLDEMANRMQSTPAAIALAWLFSKPFITAPIASATSSLHLKDIISASQLKLSPADVEALDAASAY